MTWSKPGKLVLDLLAATVVIGSLVIIRRWRHAPRATGPVSILDIPVDPLTMDEVLDRIEAYIRSGQPHHVFTADASGLMRTREDARFHSLVQQADLVTPDGAGILLASRINGMALPERVSGVDLVERISALSAVRGYRLFLFGAAEGVALAAAEKLRERHPGITIIGIRNGYFSAGEEAGIVQKITVARPDVLFVALGIPKQEEFIRAHFHELGVPVMIGIGGSFDVISGSLQRAPHWMQRAGLEWLYRFLQQPSRLPRLAALPQFVLAAWRSRQAR